MTTHTTITTAPYQGSGVSLAKATDAEYRRHPHVHPWLVSYRLNKTNPRVRPLVGHREGLAMNDTVALASVFRILAGS